MAELQYVVINQKLRVALVRDRAQNERSITVDLYRNLDDLRHGDVMERKVKLSFD